MGLDWFSLMLNIIVCTQKSTGGQTRNVEMRSLQFWALWHLQKRCDDVFLYFVLIFLWCLRNWFWQTLPGMIHLEGAAIFQPSFKKIPLIERVMQRATLDNIFAFGKFCGVCVTLNMFFFCFLFHRFWSDNVAAHSQIKKEQVMRAGLVESIFQKM